MELRIGQGVDCHPYDERADRRLVLGGVALDGPGLRGHSDADAVAHAAADALLGAAGLGDIGVHFPDTDPRWAGADSVALLAEVARLVRAEGWRPANVDCTVVADQPRLAPHRDAMQERLSGAVGAPVTVKGKRTEGLQGPGSPAGVTCFAIALLVREGS